MAPSRKDAEGAQGKENRSDLDIRHGDRRIFKVHNGVSISYCHKGKENGENGFFDHGVSWDVYPSHMQ